MPEHNHPPTPAEDTLRGVAEIAAFLGESERRVHYLLTRGLLPAGQIGVRWIASRHVLTDHFARLTSGRLEQGDPAHADTYGSTGANA